MAEPSNRGTSGSQPAEFWYRKVSVIGHYEEPRGSGHMATLTVISEEPHSETLSTHVQRVLDSLESAGFSEDMAEAEVEVHVSYRQEAL